MPRVGADHANDAIATDDLAVAADFLDRCLNSHRSGPFYLSEIPVESLRPEYDASLGQIVRCKFHRNFVTRKDADVVHPHLAGDMTQNHMSVFKLDPERCIGQRFQDFALHLNDVFFCHKDWSSTSVLGALEVRLLQQAFVLM
jgi:hypothetical protein